jgi:hypothetical protein
MNDETDVLCDKKEATVAIQNAKVGFINVSFPMNASIPDVLPFDESAMSALEDQIPDLAAGAVKFAYFQALTSGAKVLEVIDDKLVETSADGSTRFIKAMPPSYAVVAGSKKRLLPQ